MNLQLSPPNSMPVAHPHQFIPLSSEQGEEKKLELLEHWRSITKRKWAILALALFVGVVTIAITFALTPIYRSTAGILVEPNRAKILSIDDIYSGTGLDREHYQTQVEILKSREVALRTAKALKLWDHPDFDPRKRSESFLQRLKASVGVSSAVPEWDEASLAEATVGKFSASLAVEPVRLSSLIRISFDAEDKKLAAAAANKMVSVYVDLDREARLNVSQAATSWLQERLETLRLKLTKSEEALQAYREQKGLVNLSGSAQTLVGQQVSEITQRLSAARATRSELESAFKQVRLITNGDYNSIPIVTRSSPVNEARRQVDLASAKVAELSERLGAEHSSLIEARSQLRVANENVRRLTLAAVKGLEREYNAALDTERALEASLIAARGTVQDVNRQEFQLSVLEREVQTNRQLYEMFMTRAKETSVATDLQSTVARLVDPAVPSGSPIKPQKSQMVLVAVVLALFLGALISLLLDKLDNTVKGAEDAETRLHQPVLTTVPSLNEADAAHAVRIFLDQPQSHFSEAIRTARTGVLLSNIDVVSKVLLITSSVPKEGKTTVSTNLALAHSQTKRTLLIDADMRRPQVGNRLGLSPSVKGLSNLVTGSAALEECVHLLPHSSLWVMPVGNIPPNPLELLLSQRFRETLETLSKQFEVILIDSPPIELVSDALVIAPLTHGTIYVVKAMETPYQVVRKGLQRLQRAQVKILGVVLNGLDFNKAQKYYGQGKYGYGDYGYRPEAADDLDLVENKT
jgi:polysaccharide biosynthesis transport protein